MLNFYKAGTWNVICDVCGLKHKSDELRLRWDGLMVCKEDWEPRHPSDLLRVPKEDTHVPWAREDTDSVGYVCTLTDSQAIAGVGVAGCAVAGRSTLIG